MGRESKNNNVYIINKSYWLIFTYQGKTYRHRIGHINDISKREAYHIATELKARIVKGEYIPIKDERISFKEVATKYLEYYKHSRPNIQEHTIKYVESKIKILIDFFKDTPLSKITEQTIERFKIERRKNVKPQTINNDLIFLKAVFNYAKNYDLYNGKLPKIKMYKVDSKRTRFLSNDEILEIIKHCPDFFKPVVIFAVLTGFRISEILSLKWQNVDLDNGLIFIETQKSREKNIFPISTTVIELLRNLKKLQAENNINHGYVFTNRYGEPYKPDNKDYYKIFKSACRKAGLHDIRFHDLRHTFASLLALNGVDLYTIQKLLRHKSFRMSERYAHLTHKHLRIAQEKISSFLQSSFNPYIVLIFKPYSSTTYPQVFHNLSTIPWPNIHI